ncbi:MAG: TlpA family protein disulfide reductase [Gammaproteobacteria bacterium]|nr:TlpA family protein disulfide reductase [Gammaproteobacteria bacterium]
MWQALYAELAQEDFIVIAVAEESRGAETAREWIELARPTYPVLIDREHHVADLYNMVNVPQAVWIDEQGRIVRPSETAGSHDAWRSRDRASGTLPESALALAAQAKRTYVEAVRDWAQHGARSRHAFTPEQARAHLALPDDKVALANAHFRLGYHLRAAGNVTEGDVHLQLAADLRPDSWNIYRQAMNLRELGPTGLAADDDFFARVDALGSGRYYPPPDLEGFPTELGFAPRE